MKGEAVRRRLAIACLVLGLILWNLRFDAGVRAATVEFVAARDAWAAGHGTEMPLAPHMRAGQRRAARDATLLSLPLFAVGAALLLIRVTIDD
jgi:uncharacterized membrane protein YedE/YeeE